MTKVLSARYYEPHKPLRLEQVDLPRLGDDDVLIQVKAAGVCHSDLHTINGIFPPTISPPITLGHELSGEIRQKGKNVKEFELGDRVGVDYTMSCGFCKYCRIGRENLCDNLKVMAVNADGSWTEQVVLATRHVHKIPANVGFPEGAIMNCAVMTSYHAMKSARVTPGASVLIYGLGGLGTSAIQWARIFGATQIVAVDLEEEKLSLAKRMGATDVVNAKIEPVKQVQAVTNGGVDFGFEFIGLPNTITNMVRSVKKTGTAMIVGMCFEPLPLHPVNDLMLGELQILSVTDHVKSEIPQVKKFIEDGRFDLSRSVSHRFPLRDANEAVRVLNERIGNPVRVVLEP